MKVYTRWSIAVSGWGLLALSGCASGVTDAGSGSNPFGSGNSASDTGDSASETSVGGETDDGSESATEDSAASGGNDTVTTDPTDTGAGGPCDLGDSEPCYSGPAETRGQGDCVDGVRSCEGGQWGACEGEVLPAAEVCDGQDNDCNGSVDDGEASAGAACNTGMPGVCADGTEMCTGGQPGCVANVGASAETCDGLDNDCDGAVDNGNPGGGAACNTGQLGVCAAGTQTCTGGAIVCQQNTQASPNDTCFDGLDNDCDGAVDENCHNCAHDLCVTGVALTPGCHPCVDTVCAIDPFCCSSSWDNICVNEAVTHCGYPC